MIILGEPIFDSTVPDWAIGTTYENFDFGAFGYFPIVGGDGDESEYEFANKKGLRRHDD